MNVELAVLQADREIMVAYAELVTDRAIRERFLHMIGAEFELTARLLQLLFKESAAERRPMQLAAMTLRKAPLAVLHTQQIELLRQWRKAQATDGAAEAANKLLGDLFLSVNAIAGGVRNTG